MDSYSFLRSAPFRKTVKAVTFNYSNAYFSSQNSCPFKNFYKATYIRYLYNLWISKLWCWKSELSLYQTKKMILGIVFLSLIFSSGAAEMKRVPSPFNFHECLIKNMNFIRRCLFCRDKAVKDVKSYVMFCF